MPRRRRRLSQQDLKAAGTTRGFWGDAVRRVAREMLEEEKCS
jgi:hypothetical protein